MSNYKKRVDFNLTDEGIMVSEALKAMVSDSNYYTEPSFSADTDKYADNQIPFIDKHMAYLQSHPSTNPQHYLSNLKLITRIRR